MSIVGISVHSLWKCIFYYSLSLLIFLFRVAKLRDEIMALRNECSSVYSKGRMLTMEQTKLMISGITQSLNSGFAQTLNPSLNSGLTQGLTPSLTPSSVTSGLSSGLTSRLTPSVTPAYTPGFPSGGLVPSFSSGVESNSLQTLKLMQIRKPLLKSSLLDQNLTEEEVNMKFVQDLLNWVDEMQVKECLFYPKASVFIAASLFSNSSIFLFKGAAGPHWVGIRFAKCWKPFRKS